MGGVRKSYSKNQGSKKKIKGRISRGFFPRKVENKRGKKSRGQEIRGWGREKDRKKKKRPNKGR